jgi:2Fe-2S ferredoxin
MPKIIYTHFDGAETALDGNPGDSIMQTAVRNGVDGIVAECGGVLSCATCHVFVAPEDGNRFPPITAAEDAMLEGTAVDRTECSRLSCQLVFTDDMAKIHVSLPEYQD